MKKGSFKIGKKLIAAALVIAMNLPAMSSICAATETEAVIKKMNREERVLSYQEMGRIESSFADVPQGQVSCVQGTLPASYSSSADVAWEFEVQKDYVTAVKDQSPYGTCWAHTVMSAAETSYIMNMARENMAVNLDTIDFSEYHFVHYSYDTPNDPLNLLGGDYNYLPSGDFLDTGGNCGLAIYALANWIGASNNPEITADNMYEEHDDALAFADMAHLENAYILTMPDMTTDTYQEDMNIVKQMIMDYGSVATAYCSTSVGGDEFEGYYYCPYYYYSNHAVTIVGWDDTIPASAFDTKPAGDGAWLVKNSWGSEYSEFDGYFWLSYYDKSIEYNSYAYDFTYADNYDNNYQYDGTASGSYTGYWGQSAQANAFVADSKEVLEAVGFFTVSTNTDYTIRIYKNLEKNEKPHRGDLVLTQRGTEKYVGFHSVELTEGITIEEGERYAVVITFMTDNDYAYVPLDESYATDEWIQYYSFAKEGQSYFGYSHDSLDDLNAGSASYTTGSNVRIKAFTNEYETIPVTDIILNNTSAALKAGETLQLTAAVMPEDATNAKVIWGSSNAEVASVDETGLVVANSTGLAIITATAADGSGTSAACVITVTGIRATGIELNYNELTMDVGDEMVLLATITPSTATNKEITWSSLNPSVVTIDENGKLTAVREGNAIIIATVNEVLGVTATCQVTVLTPEPIGWTKKDGNWYYLDGYGEAMTGWQKINTKWYFFNESGVMQTGWLKKDGSWYYLNVDGDMQTNWKKINGKWYYFGTDGKMCTSWKKISSKWYYFNIDGDMHIGWKKLDSKWYYFNTDGDMHVSWKKLNNKWYYFNADGDMHIGWKSINGIWYYFNQDGDMHVSWKNINGTWYYFNADGDMHKGWKSINGKWYYFDSEGAMVTGKYKINGTWNTFTSDGVWVG